MTLTKTPICDFGKKAESFELKSIENKIVSLNDVKGKNGTLIMFICNHCPYVKAVINDIVNDSNILKKKKCRIGVRPFFYQISENESLDLDTEDDFRYLEYYVKRYLPSTNNK